MSKIKKEEIEMPEDDESSSGKSVSDFIDEIHDHIKGAGLEDLAGYEINEDLAAKALQGGLNAFQAVTLAGLVRWI
jgi:hypothetical protein